MLQTNCKTINNDRNDCSYPKRRKSRNNDEWAQELTLKEVEHKLYMEETLA